MRNILFVLLIQMLMGQVFAREAFNFTIDELYRSSRALGMGGAMVAAPPDADTLYYNPAGLARVQEGILEFSFRGGIGSDVLGLLGDIDDASSGDGSQQSSTELLQLIEDNYGEEYYFEVPTLHGHWVRKGWGVGFVPANVQAQLILNRSIGPTLNVDSYVDSFIYFGYARKFNWLGDKNFSIGTSLKLVHRGQFQRKLSAIELAQDSEVVRIDDAGAGLTVDADIGALYTPPVPEKGFFSFLQYAKPTFGVTLRNVADWGFFESPFLGDENVDEPERLERRLDIGSSWEYPSFWVFQPRGVIDFRNIGHRNYNFVKGLHIGFELGWEPAKWLKGAWRLGLNQGYWTAGFTGDFSIFKLDLVTWGEEIYTSSSRIESRRYMAEFNLTF